jgi:hypothetical protein
VATQDLGPDPSRPNDVVDVAWVSGQYPFFSMTLTSSINVVLSLPSDPADHTMVLFEVIATGDITVMCPEDTVLTIGPQFVTALPTGKTGFFGFRYSATSGVWFLLSSTAQV